MILAAMGEYKESRKQLKQGLKNTSLFSIFVNLSGNMS
jgi:hypothetical protein